MKSHSLTDARGGRDARAPSSLRQSMTTPCQRWALGMAYLLLTLSGAQATPLTLSTAPPTNSGSEPRPNVIITVDDSGSMDWDINDNSTSTTAN